MECVLRPVVGISACLSGERVRYDGRDKHVSWLQAGFWGGIVFVTLCPEVECGLGVPRPPMRLEGDATQPRLVVIDTGMDLTARLESWARRRCRELERGGLSGFIFKARSPSCGVSGVDLFDAHGRVHGHVSGLFVRVVRAHFPGLPVAEAESLRDRAAREEFLVAVQRYARMGTATGSG